MTKTNSFSSSCNAVCGEGAARLLSGHNQPNRGIDDQWLARNDCCWLGATATALRSPPNERPHTEACEHVVLQSNTLQPRVEAWRANSRALSFGKELSARQHTPNELTDFATAVQHVGRHVKLTSKVQELQIGARGHRGGEVLQTILCDAIPWQWMRHAEMAALALWDRAVGARAPARLTGCQPVVEQQATQGIAAPAAPPAQTRARREG